MVTEDEIRARVQAADLTRSQARAEAAAKIAAYVIRRKKVRAELAEIDSAIGAAVAESSAIMSVTELSEFIGVPLNELTPPVDAPVPALPRRQARRKVAGARKIRPAAPPASETTVAVSSDF